MKETKSWKLACYAWTSSLNCKVYAEIAKMRVHEAHADKAHFQFDLLKVAIYHTSRHQDKKRSPIISVANSSCRFEIKSSERVGSILKMVCILDMESYYYSGWPLNTSWPQCNAAKSSETPFSVPTPILPHVSDSKSAQFYEFPPWSSPFEGSAEDRAASASKSHSQAEKRRRDRINAQLATLRKLIPKSDKMDKAALLGSVIDHVKDLKRKAMDIDKALTVPSEIDEVTIDYDPAQDETCTKISKFKDKIIIKASVCCDDRPELFSELIQVLKGSRLTAVKADIASVGGRVKSILVLCSKDSEEGVCLSTLKQSLKSAVNKVATSSMASTCAARSKRQRFFLPAHYTQ
ncbi:hypothetical protein L6164_029745 [Bauhinia variegata]|uniref:Uncharacterized protein n=1 Tax=Bauhinia variegata TaxID=167791 RepID=A0ACB9LB19_BAUVA|nr:hypothetical protein L6164_029745 [Bauhinia variegata]